MKILIVHKGTIPVFGYGGVERVVWWLGKELVNQGHEVTYLVGKNSTCSFAKILIYNPNLKLDKQIQTNVDVVHVFLPILEPLTKPYIVSVQGNTNKITEYDINSVFASRNHAERHNSNSYVYNGIDIDDYGIPNLCNKREYLHFLAKAAWRVKNVKGAIEIARRSGQKLAVIGGHRLNFNMGFRLTLNFNVRFHGMVGGMEKNKILNNSKGLLFPVLWHEPFGLAIIESLYFGCPVFGTEYGSLPELVTNEVGFLSNKKSEIINKLNEIDAFDRKTCHEYVCDQFTSKQMTYEYLKLYEKVLDGNTINQEKPKFIDIQKEKFLPFND